MNKHARVIKGDVIFSRKLGKYEKYRSGFVVLFGNHVKGVFEELPEEFSGGRVIDYSGKLIIPGLVNQFISMDEEDLESLELLLKEIWAEGITRFNMLASSSVDMSHRMMEAIENSGLGANVCKRDEGDERKSLSALEEFVVMSMNRHMLVSPMVWLGSESGDLFFKKINIGDRYSVKTIGFDIEPEEFQDGKQRALNLVKEKETNGSGEICSSYSPYEDCSSEKLYADECTGIYTDGGCSGRASILEAIRFERSKANGFSLCEMFYMATKGGGKFFGEVGSFEEGYEFDALVIDDSNISSPELDLKERLENFLLNGSSENIEQRYVFGMKALGV